MYWKRKTNSWDLLKTAFLNLFPNNLFPKKERKDSELFQFESTERRQWFRVQPSAILPIMLRFGEEEVEVYDIGAAGLSFKNEHFSIGETRASRIDLPELAPTIHTVLKILTIDEKDICHCKIKKIQESAVERIHQYVLKRQKEILQEKKKTAKPDKETMIQIKSETEDDPISFRTL